MLRESRGAGAGSGRTSRRGFPAPVGDRPRALTRRPLVCPRHPAVCLPLSPPPEGETGHQRTRLAAACSFYCCRGATCAVPDLRPPFRSLRCCLCVRLCFSVREENTSTSDLRVVPRVGFYASQLLTTLTALAWESAWRCSERLALCVRRRAIKKALRSGPVRIS